METKKVYLQMSLFKGEERELKDLPEQVEDIECINTKGEIEMIPEEISGQLNLFETEVN